MPKRFDATGKHLLEAHAGDWTEYLDLQGRKRISVIDANLSTVTAEADKVLRIEDPGPYLAHVELQAGYERHLGQRLLRYNVLLQSRHRLPVQSVVVLLRPQADGPAMTGVVQSRLPGGECYLEFHYKIVRAWQKPVEEVLAGGLGTLPMAPLSDVSPEALPGVIRRMDERLRRETTPAEAATLWTATYVLMGLRYPSDVVTELLQGVRAVKESSTYQAIVAEGRADGLRKALLIQGRNRFGPPVAEIVMALESIHSEKRLERLHKRLPEVSNWQELLGAPRSRRRKG
jgi:hypothetical protein